MSACARCGARLADPKEPCRRCGTPAEKPPGETLVLGSPAVPSPRAATLLLGSGVPLDESEAPSNAQEGGRPAERPLTPPLPPAPAARPRRRRAARLPAPEPEPPPPLATPPTRASRPKRVPGAALALVAVVALVAGALLVVATRGRAALSGRVVFDAKGQPVLELGCADCPNGTEARSGAEAATFLDGKARLPLTTPLALGATGVGVDLRRPGAARFDSAKLPVAVDFIVSRDLSGLSKPKPELSLVFETKPGVSVIVDGSALPLGSAGTRRHEVEITRDVTGAASGVERVSRTVPYGIRLADGTLLRGSIELSAEVAPLAVDAPIDSIVVDGASFTLAGSTQPEGTVSVDGRPITVDPTGHFAQLMSVSAIGDTTITVRASAPGRAPRLVPIRVRRVASLEVEADQFAARATRSYGAIAEGMEQKAGWAVALSGSIREVEQRGHAAAVLMEVSDGCAKGPCLLRLEIGARCGFSVGDRIRAFGYLAGKWQEPSSGRALPRVRVEFLRGES